MYIWFGTVFTFGLICLALKSIDYRNYTLNAKCNNNNEIILRLVSSHS